MLLCYSKGLLEVEALRLGSKNTTSYVGVKVQIPGKIRAVK